jgi:uncharacterized membrane protein YkoI
MNSIIKRTTIASAAVLALVAGVVYAAEKEGDEKDQKVDFNALPAAVRATAEANAQGGKITEAELEIEDGKQQYSIEVKKDSGTKFDIEIAPDGKLLKVDKEEAADETEGYEGDDKSNEEKIDLTAAPAPVQAALQKALNSSTLDELIKETEDGATVYEAEYKVADMPHSLKLAASGAILEQENNVSTATLSAEVTAAVQKKFPNAQISQAEEVTQHFYELDIVVDGKKQEVKVSAAGQIQGDDEEDEDDEADKED